MLSDKKVNAILKKYKIEIARFDWIEPLHIAQIGVKGHWRGDGHNLTVTADHLGYNRENPFIINGWGRDRDSKGNVKIYPFRSKILPNLARDLGVPKVDYIPGSRFGGSGYLEFTAPETRYTLDTVCQEIGIDINAYGGIVPVGISENNVNILLAGNWLFTGFVDGGMKDVRDLMKATHPEWIYLTLYTKKVALTAVKKLETIIDHRIKEKNDKPKLVSFFFSADEWGLPLGKILDQGESVGVYVVVRSDVMDKSRFHVTFEGGLGDGDFVIRGKTKSGVKSNDRVRMFVV
jgi:hypothetical protein